MTWSERHLVESGTKVRAAHKLLSEALQDLDVSKYPIAFGLIKGAVATTEGADRALADSIHGATERIAK